MIEKLMTCLREKYPTQIFEYVSEPLSNFEDMYYKIYINGIEVTRFRSRLLEELSHLSGIDPISELIAGIEFEGKRKDHWGKSYEQKLKFLH
jgi:hypothetical protein